MKQKFICLLLLLILIVPCNAQRQTTPLKIGDTIPADFVFQEMLNYPSSSLKLSSLKGKWIILDFWSTFCATCLKKLPEMSSLQKKFKDDVVILPVGLYGKQVSEIRKYYKEKILTDTVVCLPTAVEEIFERDSMFRELFPHQGLPHIIWIDPQQTIAAITSGEEVTYENISAFLAGRNPMMKEKKPLRVINPSVPFLISGSSTMHHFGSLFSSYKDTAAYNAGYFEFFNDSIRRIVQVNRTARQLYQCAYQKRYGKDWLNGFSGKKRIWISGEQKTTNGDTEYCYELVCDGSKSIHACYDKMIGDLDFRFNFKSCLLEEEIDCYQVVPIKQVIKVRNRKSTENINLLRLRDMTIDQVAERLNSPGTGNFPLFINRTVMKEKVDLFLKEGSYSTIDELNFDLMNSGLCVQLARAKLEILEIN